MEGREIDSPPARTPSPLPNSLCCKCRIRNATYHYYKIIIVYHNDFYNHTQLQVSANYMTWSRMTDDLKQAPLYYISLYCL